jgi:hypothetical protein
LEIEAVDLVLTSGLPCPCPIYPTYRVTTFAGSVGTEKRLRSNGHAKKFLRLNNVRGVGP